MHPLIQYNYGADACFLVVRPSACECAYGRKCIRDNDTVNSFETSQRLGLHVVVLFTATHTSGSLSSSVVAYWNSP